MDEKKSIFHTVRQIVEGRRMIDNEFKFRVFCLLAAFFHLIFCICMYRMGTEIMFYYNILIVIGYCYMGIKLAADGKYTLIGILALLEIEIHSTLATFLMGSQFNFMFYTIAMISASFYLSRYIVKGPRHLFCSVLFSLMIIVCYVTVVLLQPHVRPLYDTSRYPGMVKGIGYFNICIAFFLQVAFALIFELEAGYMSQLLERENVKLSEDANYDPLTMLWNRRSLTTAVTEAINTMEHVDVFSVVMLDIDDFKSVNDTYGHDTGDTVLVGLADIIREEVRQGDYSCRWGGEEFLIFAHGHRNEVQYVAERILQRLRETKFEDSKGKVFSVTLTAGVAEFRYGAQLRNVIEAADKRLYYGKTHGKNQVVASN